MGGDSDTIACLVGSALGLLHGSDWLPLRWVEQLEDNKERDKGSKWLEGVGKSSLVWYGDELVDLFLT